MLGVSIEWLQIRFIIRKIPFFSSKTALILMENKIFQDFMPIYILIVFYLFNYHKIENLTIKYLIFI